MSKQTIDTVAVIGVGLLGGSLGLALKKNGLAGRVIGVARRSETIPTAIELGAIDEGSLDPIAAVSQADLVFLATPVLQMPRLLEVIAPALSANCIVTDTGSSKENIVEFAAALGIRSFVGGHPMAGSEKKGVAYARPDLFSGRTYFLTPTAQTDEAALTTVRDLVTGFGAIPVILPPERHDRIVAITSHLPHLLASSLIRLALATSKVEPLLEKGMATGLRDITRIASGDVEMWRDIYISNRNHLLDALDSLEEILAQARALLKDGDAPALAQLLSEAKDFRERVYGAQPGGPGAVAGDSEPLKSQASSPSEPDRTRAGPKPAK